MTSGQSLQFFLTYLKTEKKSSAHTLLAYKNDLEGFLKFIDAFEIEVSNLGYRDVRSWSVFLLQSSLNPKSVNRKISALSAWFRFLQRNDLLKSNPIEKLARPKNGKRLPAFVDEKSMESLFQQTDFFEKNWQGDRDAAILTLLYQTGMRRAELTGLRLQDLDFSGKIVRVLGKRNKERIIPLLDNTIEVLTPYLTFRNSIHPGHTFFFIRQKNHEPILPMDVYRLVKKYLSKICTAEKLSPHVLRHTFATHLLNRGADLNAIKELLGHSSLAATQVYTHNSFERLKNIHLKAHPRSGD